MGIFGYQNYFKGLVIIDSLQKERQLLLLPAELLLKQGIPIIIKLRPLKETTILLPRRISIAHPKVSPKIVFLLRHNPEHTR